jgi:hypothetical protein
VTLETVTLPGIDIFAAGGPYFGQGSPPEGDTYSADDLARIAAANNALADEVRVPITIGHGREQRLLKNSGLRPDEQPSAGWVENFRVVGGKLLADFRAVPRKLAELIEAGAFRTRSVELRPVASQRTRQMFDMAVTAVALLGGAAPAIRTLDDIARLYEDDTPRARTITVADRAGNAVEMTPEEALRAGATTTNTIEEAAAMDYLLQTGVMKPWQDPRAGRSWERR